MQVILLVRNEKVHIFQKRIKEKGGGVIGDYSRVEKQYYISILLNRQHHCTHACLRMRRQFCGSGHLCGPLPPLHHMCHWGISSSSTSHNNNNGRGTTCHMKPAQDEWVRTVFYFLTYICLNRKFQRHLKVDKSSWCAN